MVVVIRGEKDKVSIVRMSGKEQRRPNGSNWLSVSIN